ncbi:MAG: hypothetical protein GC204_13270 [Chloroflexi bacterium]|nr:hypothetical protein [Chloroflexota bacterium]
MKAFVSRYATAIIAIGFIISLGLTLKTFHDAMQWFSLLQPAGLPEIQAKTIRLEQRGNVTSIRYEYQVLNPQGVLIDYTGVLDIQDVSLEIGSMKQKFQDRIPIEYLPDAPIYSIVSKSQWPQIYQQQLENSIMAKWWNALLAPLLFALISLVCLILFIRQIRKYMQQLTKA